jgi:restriction system protein
MTGRAVFRITRRGRKLLETKPEAITIRLLMQFPEFKAFRTSRGPARDSGAEPDHDAEQTPREVLDSCYQTLRQALAEELLANVRARPPGFFEQLVVDLLVSMGYGGSRTDAGKAMGRTGDEGVDGVIKEDKLGLDAVYVQAKRWVDTVGRPVVQSFAGSLMGLKARKGVLITTSSFSREARDYADSIQERNIVLIDGEQLAQLMIDHDIGVSEVDRYVVKQVDNDYFGG